MATETKKRVVLEVAFTFGDIVFLRTRADRVAGMVTRMIVTKACVIYYVTWGNNASETSHFDYELTEEYVPTFEG